MISEILLQLFLGIIICMMSLHMYFAPPNKLLDIPSAVKSDPESLKEVSVDRRMVSWRKETGIFCIWDERVGPKFSPLENNIHTLASLFICWEMNPKSGIGSAVFDLQNNWFGIGRKRKRLGLTSDRHGTS